MGKETKCPCGEPSSNDPDLTGPAGEDWVCGRCWMGIDQYGVESEVFAASRAHRKEHGSTYSCAHEARGEVG